MVTDHGAARVTCCELFRHDETVAQHQAVSPGIRLPVTCCRTGIEPAQLWQHHADQNPGIAAPSSAVGDERCSMADHWLAVL